MVQTDDVGPGGDAGTDDVGEGVGADMSAHTPGPWSISPYIGPSHGVCVVGADGMEVAEEITSAFDARLIAAAPDLLAALEGMLKRHAECGTEMQWDGRGGPDPLIAARAAIAKSRGGK